MTASESTFAPLRRRERQWRISALRQRLRDTLGTNDCSVWLFGSLARGDWVGFLGYRFAGGERKPRRG